MAATVLMQVAGICAYHTSVILGEKEYFFDSEGIASGPALWSHHGGVPGQPVVLTSATEVFTIGFSHLNGTALCQGLDNFFSLGSYDVILKNCNSFTDAACYFLTRRRLHGKYTRLERLLAGTRPVSTKLLSALLGALVAGDEDAAQEYVPNPRAENFSVEDIVASCDSLDAASRRSESAPAMPRDWPRTPTSVGRGHCSAVCNPLACLLTATEGGGAHAASTSPMEAQDPLWNTASPVSGDVVTLFESVPLFPGQTQPGTAAEAASPGSHSGTSPAADYLGFDWSGTVLPTPQVGASTSPEHISPPPPTSLPQALQDLPRTLAGSSGRRIVFL